MGETISPLARMIRELRRRRVFRTAALYVVGTWVLLQVCDVVFPALDIPEHALRYVLTAAVMAFPVALVFGWFYDIGADGIRRTGPAKAGEAALPESLQRADYLILSALAAVAVAVLWGTLGNVVPGETSAEPVADDGPTVLAVLPFGTSGAEGDSAFFASGMHEDLISQLSQLQSIRVISRSSVSEYRNTGQGLRQVGADLGADAIVQGIVRSAEDRIRINVELVDAATLANLWGRSYDRLLTPQNLFEVQSEMAMAITVALRAALSPEDRGRLAMIPTDNMAAYRAYREAMEIGEAQGRFRTPEFREALERAVALDPDFTRAQAELVGALVFENFFFEFDPALTERAEGILEHLRATAPGSADHLIAMTYYSYYVLKDYEEALGLVSQAQNMRPSDTSVLTLKTWIQRRLGDAEGYLATLRLMRTLDPRDRMMTTRIVNALLLAHRYDELSAELEATADEHPWFAWCRNLLELREHGDLQRWAEGVLSLQREYGEQTDPGWLFEAHLATGDFDAAREIAERSSPDSNELIDPVLQVRAIAARFQGDEASLATMLESMSRTLEEYEDSEEIGIQKSVAYDQLFIAAMVGDTEEAARWGRRALRLGRTDLASFTLMRIDVCQGLAMAAAAADAVACLRDAFAEPSRAIPFLEPLLPYYDSIRETPEFRSLLADLRASGDLPEPGAP